MHVILDEDLVLFTVRHVSANQGTQRFFGRRLHRRSTDIVKKLVNAGEEKLVW